MIGYKYISDLFRSILKHSEAISGRYFVCPRMGREINADEFEQIIKEQVTGAAINKRYPAALQMPPVSFGPAGSAAGTWERNQLILFFLKPTNQVGVGQIASPNYDRLTSNHSVEDDWHDMKRVAIDFIKMLDILCRKKNLISSAIRMVPDYDYKITPVSLVGADHLSGVRLDFFIEILIECPASDYEGVNLADIELPATDPHPKHPL